MLSVSLEITDSSVLIKGSVLFSNVKVLCTESEQFLKNTTMNKVVVDFSELDKVDNSLFALLLFWHRAAIAKGIKLEFKNLPDAVVKLAQLTGIDDVLLN